MRILLVDDDPDLRNLFKDLLELRGGHEVTTAKDGVEGVFLFQIGRAHV
jgi:CheY-like chemotaxis protein